MKLVRKGAATVFLLSILVGSSQTAFAAELDKKEYETNAIVQFTPDTTPTEPIDPVNPDTNNPVKPFDPTTPDNQPKPGTTGPLSIDFASSIDFGINKITSKDVTYFANPQFYWNADQTGADLTTARPNYVQISDKRGNNAGWTLTVKQNGQFSNATTQNAELKSAQIKLVQGTAVTVAEGVTLPTTHEVILNPNGDLSNVMTAAKGTGSGTWVDRFGAVEDVEIDGVTVQKNTGISLSIPQTTPIDAVKYETSLTWTLSEIPDNA